MFWALLSAHFSPRYARAKMSLSRAQNIFTPVNINYIVILTIVTRVTRITRKLHMSGYSKCQSLTGILTGIFTGFLIEHFDFIL